ncbi:uncharacterized protein LOC110109882 [Dendrobium catenatum]|uniref:uncharacterized protein LOC110109882 n=1 Tax=Dendrobium catenatum TaxID=906689 RepID=UPI0009F2D180|nr:uncharacterized protein LOC110109882 [Dendrobium catenatum]
MANDGRRPVMAGGTLDVRRSPAVVFQNQNRPFTNSPPTFGDDFSAISQVSNPVKRSSIFINEGGFISSNKILELEKNCSGVAVIETGIYIPDNVVLSSEEVTGNNKINIEDNEAIENAKEADLNFVRDCNSRELGNCIDHNVIPARSNNAIQPNVWSKKSNIKVVDLDLGDFLSKDGEFVKLHADKEIENTRKLQYSLVVKVFGSNVPFPIVSTELRKQWSSFGKFHLTMLGSTGKFFQKLEYERLPNLCFDYGKLGHLKKDCNDKTLGGINVSAGNNDIQEKETIKSSNLTDPSVKAEKTNEAMDHDNLVEEGEIVDNVKNLDPISRNVSMAGYSTDSASMTDYKEDEMKKVMSFDRKDVDLLIGPDWDFFHVPSEGLSGGLIALWKANLVRFQIVEFCSQFIIGNLDIPNKGIWRIASIYGNKDSYKRRRNWERLEVYSSKDLAMVLGGDFNCILSKDDKRGGKRFLFAPRPKEMKSFLALNDFDEVDFVGSKFTWSNNKKGVDRILERIDRCFINSAALNSPHRLVVRHLARVASDHFLVVLNLVVQNSAKKVLIFEEVWASNKASLAVIKGIWRKKIDGS